jgi:hypothetical protein
MARSTEKARNRSAEPEGAKAARNVIDAGERFQQGAEEGSRQFAVMGEQAFAAWMRTGNETFQRVIDLNVELASWGREQLDDNMKAARSMAQCRNVGDACGVQLELIRSSMETSIRRASAVLAIAAQAMTAASQAEQRPE